MSHSHGRRLSPVALLFTVITITFALCCALPALAQVGPPSWWGALDENTVSMSFQFPTDAWPPIAGFSALPSWYEGTTWTKGGTRTPQWAANLSGHTGVWGLTSGAAGEGSLELKLDNQPRDGWVKHVWYQFDLYLSGGGCCLTEDSSPDTGISNKWAIYEELQFGWQRVTGGFDVYPQPAWETLTWDFVTPSGGYAAIDNVYVASHCMVPEPSSLAALDAMATGLLFSIRRRKRI